jgi:hypothetical protein
MINNSLQGSLQEAIRSALGCANTFEGDLHALCDLYGVANGHQDARLIGAAQKHDSTIGTASGALNYFLLNPTLPTFGLNFVDGTDTLDSRVTFTRASSGTRFNSAGVLVTASTNQPRFDYDPVTLAIRGLLIEEQRTNLLLQSAALDNASWTKSNSTVTANAVSAPDGTLSADKVVEDTATAGHLVLQAATVSTGSAYTASAFVKASERTRAAIYMNETGATGNRATVGFNLTTGAIDNAAATVGTFSGASATIASVGGGWYRISLTATVVATSVQVRLMPLDASASAVSPSYLGDGTSGIYLWGAQLEAGSFATSYTPTTTAAATRAADVAVVSSLAGWFNALQGTLVGRGAVATPAAYTGYIADINDGTTSNRIGIYRQSDSQPVAQVVTGGVSQAQMGMGATWTDGAARRLALAYAANDFAACTNGGTVQTDASGSIPTVTQMSLGQLAGSGRFNGWLQQIAYYPTRLPNATLQALTA